MTYMYILAYLNDMKTRTVISYVEFKRIKWNFFNYPICVYSHMFMTTRVWSKYTYDPVHITRFPKEYKP